MGQIIVYTCPMYDLGAVDDPAGSHLFYALEYDPDCEASPGDTFVIGVPSEVGAPAYCPDCRATYKDQPSTFRDFEVEWTPDRIMDERQPTGGRAEPRLWRTHARQLAGDIVLQFPDDQNRMRTVVCYEYLASLHLIDPVKGRRPPTLMAFGFEPRQTPANPTVIDQKHVTHVRGNIYRVTHRNNGVDITYVVKVKAEPPRS